MLKSDRSVFEKKCDKITAGDLGKVGILVLAAGNGRFRSDYSWDWAKVRVRANRDQNTAVD